MDSQKRCDMACEILRATHDGDDLAPEHLKLVENWVNGFLNEKGEEAFCQLHEMVKNGYKKPWLQGVEPFTIDHVGYVYWNGKQIEHFTSRYAYSPEAKKNLIELGKRCEFLESKGLAVDCINVIWRWEKVSAGFGQN